MKRIYHIISCVILFCAIGFDLFAQKDFLGIPSITLNDTEYFLKWSSKTKSGRFLEEFIQQKETVTNYSMKLVLECSPENKTVEDEVHELMGKLAVKKEQNIVFSFEQIDSPVEGELWIEYVQGNVQGGQSFTMEWNLNRYRLVNNRVVLFRVIHKVYDKELDDFMKTVNKRREKWINEAVSFPMDSVNVNTK